jgi:hypothetical protein
MKTQFKTGRRFRVLLPLIMTAVQLGLLAASLIVPRQPWVVPYPPESHQQSQSQCSGDNCASLSPSSSHRGVGRLLKVSEVLNFPAVFLAAFLYLGVERLHVHTNESWLLAFTAMFVPLIWYRVGKWIDDQSMFQNQNQSTHLRMKSAWKIVVRVIAWCLLGFGLISSMGSSRDYITAALILWSGAYLAGGLLGDWRRAERVYRMRSSQRVVAIVLLVVGLLFSVAIWVPVLSGRRDPKFLKMMFPILFLTAAALFTIRAFRSLIRLSDEAIELHGFSGARILPLDKIRGRRRYLSRGDEDSPDVWHLVLESNDDRFPKLDIEELYRFDDKFYAWFTSLPDLDELGETRPKPSTFGLIDTMTNFIKASYPWWFSMWFKPRETIQSIVDNNPKQSVLLLAALSGISKVLDQLSLKNAADTFSLSGILAIAIILGPIIGIAYLYVGGFLLKHTGHWLGGKSSGTNVRAAIAWSCVPLAWSLLLLIPELALFGKEWFARATPTMDAHPYLAMSFGAIEVTMAIWTLIVLSKSLGQVHGFSAWRALGACLIAAPLMVVVIGSALLVPVLLASLLPA